MNWTRPSDLRGQVQKLWDKGLLLNTTGLAFPLRLRLISPTSSELTERFDEVRAWNVQLRQGAAPLRIVEREFRHRVLGSNALPREVWLDSADDALTLLGKQKEARRFADLVQTTQARQAALLPWLHKRPLNALSLVDAWPRLLDLVSWLQAHPRPGIYLRQVDVPGVDSKFIEANRSVLAELFDLASPDAAVDQSVSGSGQFCRRYGFTDKPPRIRFRLLDAGQAMLSGVTEQDIGLTQAAFAELNPAASRVFITENEVNFLAFPPLPDSLVVFGAGYGFDAMKGAHWLQQRRVYYWGDIDTHGFAILDQLRGQLPHAKSLLMDEATLMAHEAHWGDEPQPSLRDLPRLNAAELMAYNTLRENRLRPRLRLEQERVGFGWLQAALAGLLNE